MIYHVIKPFHVPTNPQTLVKIGPVESEMGIIRGLEVDH